MQPGTGSSSPGGPGTPTQYMITVTQTGNGGIAPVTGLVDAGSNALYTITADNGYHIVDVLVDSVSEVPLGAILSLMFRQSIL